MAEKNILIAGKQIGTGQKPFIIAEMSGNHNHSIERAFEIVDAAADAGADAIKLQTYTADTMTIDVKSNEFVLADGLWQGKSLHDLYQEAYTPWEWHAPIFEHCKKRGIIGFSSAFDLTSVDFLETLDVPIYKISSLEIIDTELVAKVAQTGKPMIMSTGMATISEIDEAVRVARENGAVDLILLYCTSAYPTKFEDANIASMPMLGQMFDVNYGLSDHTMGSHVPVAAVALGACVIEKHFTLSRADGGVDSAFSLEPAELSNLCQHTKEAASAIGSVSFGASAAEATSRSSRRSLYIVEDMKAGDVFTDSNLKSIRPGLGLPIKYREHLIGAKVSCDVARGTPMSWDLI